MRFVTFEQNKETKVGLEILGKGIIDLQKADKKIPNSLNEIIKSFDSFKNILEQSNASQNIHYSLNEVKLLAPIPVPIRDIICVGKNYAEHAKEVQRSSYSTLQGKQAVPDQPIIFTKATTSVIGPNEKIELKNDASQSTDYEGELGVIIGKRSKNISKSNAFDIIFGYTILIT